MLVLIEGVMRNVVYAYVLIFLEVEYVLCALCEPLKANFQLNVAKGIPDNRWRVNVLKTNTGCDNIYIWKKERNAFISLLNDTLGAAGTTDLRALQGRSVRVIADNMLPYITSSNNSKELGGYLGDIWNIIQEALKFQNEITSVNYDRGLELITEGKADVMLAAVVEKKGLSNVAYSQPYFYNWYHLYIKKPTPRASSTSYLKTFDPQLWHATAIICGILTISLWFTTKLLHVSSRQEYAISVPTCLLIVCGGFLNQGYDTRIRSYSARIQIFLAFVLGYLLYCAMNAVLVARLAVFDIELPYKSLEDIAEKRTHSLCLRTNSFVYNNFVYSNFTKSNKTVLPLWANIINGPGCLDINDQTNLAKILCKDGLIFLENRVVMSTVIRNNQIPCDVSFLNTRYFQKPNYFLLLKSFKEKAVINSFVKRIKSTGILKRLEAKWIRKEQMEEINAATVPVVTIHHVTGLLTLYFVTVLASIMAFVCEKMYERYLDKNSSYIKRGEVFAVKK